MTDGIVGRVAVRLGCGEWVTAKQRVSLTSPAAQVQFRVDGIPEECAVKGEACTRSFGGDREEMVQSWSGPRSLAVPPEGSLLRLYIVPASQSTWWSFNEEMLVDNQRWIVGD